MSIIGGEGPALILRTWRGLGVVSSILNRAQLLAYRLGLIRWLGSLIMILFGRCRFASVRKLWLQELLIGTIQVQAVVEFAQLIIDT